MKLLIIEDNRLLASSLKGYLERSFSVHMVHTAAEGVTQAESKQYDLIVLDLHLPDGTGLEVCTALRKAGVDTPILILTATKETVTKVQLLDAGADDFLTKPFQAAELRARLHALLRRVGTQFPTLKLKLHDLHIDSTTRTVERGGRVVELRRKEFDILEYLVRNQGRVVSRQMIMDHVWDTGPFRSSNIVDVQVKHLRDKIDRGYERSLIETVYGLGYIVR